MIRFLSLINHSTMITLFVFVMMVFIDYINVLTKGRMTEVVKGEKSRQYFIAYFQGTEVPLKTKGLQTIKRLSEQNKKDLIPTISKI
jgi:hypothetical protein